MFIFHCDFFILVQKILIPQKYANGGEVDGGWCFLVSVFIFIFSDEIQTKWNLTIIVFDLFIEKRNFWNLVAKFDI